MGFLSLVRLSVLFTLVTLCLLFVTPSAHASLLSHHSHSRFHQPHELLKREEYTCSASKPCLNEACCGISGWCGFGPTYCGAGNCTSSCDAKAPCGQYAKVPGTTCPLNTCCSEHGFCGTTQDFCTGKCQSNCVLHPQPLDNKGSGVLSKGERFLEARLISTTYILQ